MKDLIVTDNLEIKIEEVEILNRTIKIMVKIGDVVYKRLYAKPVYGKEYPIVWSDPKWTIGRRLTYDEQDQLESIFKAYCIENNIAMDDKLEKKKI